ncbi:MAG: MATE family efflux transporter [Pleomorphochaeta sp.]
MKAINEKELRFSKKYLLYLILPLFGEQFLSILVGVIDSIMVASYSEAAISGVSLIDSLYSLFFFLISAFTTGGAVVTSQYLGRGDKKRAKAASKALLYISLFFGILIALLFLPIQGSLISFIYGDLDIAVYDQSLIYFDYVFISIPFLCLFASGSALFRSVGNSKISLKISILMNILNVVLNAVFIYGLKMGIKGAGIATLVSRIVSGVLMFIFLITFDSEIKVENILKVNIDFSILKKIFSISIPNAIENSVFQVGKIAVQSIVASLGVASIAANVVVNNLCTFAILPGTAVSLASTTIIGQCLGAREKDQAKYYTSLLLKISLIAILSFCVVIFILLKPIISLYNLSAEATTLATNISTIVLILTSILWTFSFATPNILRSAGDVKYTLVCSLISLILCRILGAVIFTKVFDLGLYGVWFAMMVDWICRSSCYITRLKGETWLNKKVI